MRGAPPSLAVGLAVLLAAAALPPGGADATVPQHLLDELRSQGYVLVRQALARDVVERARPAVVATAAEIVRRCGECASADAIFDPSCAGCERTRATPAGMPKSFAKARNLHRQSKAVRQLILSRPLLALAGAMLGTDRLRLYQDTAFFKEPGDVESAWHQDQVASPLETDAQLLTVWIPLDAVVSARQGTLAFASGSHTPGAPLSLRGLGLGERIDGMRHLAQGELEQHFKVSAPQNYDLGDVSVHLGWTYHRAGPNQSERSRRALAVSFFRDGARAHPDFLHHSPPGAAGTAVRGIEFLSADGAKTVARTIRDDLSTWLPWLLNDQLRPGAPIDTPLAPRLRVPAHSEL